LPQVDPVILQLKADVADYQRDLTRAQRITDDKLDRIGRAGTATGVALRKGFDLAKGAAIGFAASVGVEAIVGAIKTGLDYAASLGEVAQQLGVTTAALQEYRYAGSQAGLSTEEVDQALSQLTRRIGEAAEGTKAQAEAFKKLGISVKDANGQVLDAGRAIPLIADALQQIESPAERAALLMDLFGRAGQKLEPLLAGGAGAVNNLRNAAHELGIVLSDEQIQRADETADKLDSLKQVLSAKIAGAVADNTGAVLALADALERLVSSAAKAINAWKEYRLEVGVRQQQSIIDGFATSQGAKAAARLTQGAMRTEINRMNRPGVAVKPGEVRTLGGKVYNYKVAPNATPTAKLSGADGFGLSSRFGEGVSGPAGRGPGIAALLGTNPVAAVKAANALTTEMQRLAADIALAQAELSDDLSAQAAARKQQIDAGLRATLDRLKSDEDLTKEQRAELSALETQRASLERQAIDQQLSEDLTRDALDQQEKRRDALEANARLELDALAAESDLADTRTERLAIERRILDLRQEAERAALDEAIAAGEIADAAGARAALARRQAAEGSGLERDFEGPLARYARDAKDSRDRVEEAAARRIADLNDTIADTMAKALGVKDPFLRDLLKIFLDQNVFGPLAESLSSRGGGGGGLLGGLFSAVGSLFGVGGGIGGGLSKDGGLTGGFLRTRASGGYAGAGQLLRINEGASPGRVEGFIPQGSGEIIPLGRMNAMGRGSGGAGVVRVIIEEGPNFMSTIRAEATGVAIEVTKATAPQIVKGAVAETSRQLGRPRM
jgi:hypothetical protein